MANSIQEGLTNRRLAIARYWFLFFSQIGTANRNLFSAACLSCQNQSETGARECSVGPRLQEGRRPAGHTLPTLPLNWTTVLVLLLWSSSVLSAARLRYCAAVQLGEQGGGIPCQLRRMLQLDSFRTASHAEKKQKLQDNQKKSIINKRPIFKPWPCRPFPNMHVLHWSPKGHLVLFKFKSSTKVSARCSESSWSFLELPDKIFPHRLVNVRQSLFVAVLAAPCRANTVRHLLV